MVSAQASSVDAASAQAHDAENADKPTRSGGDPTRSRVIRSGTATCDRWRRRINWFARASRLWVASVAGDEVDRTLLCRQLLARTTTAHIARPTTVALIAVVHTTQIRTIPSSIRLKPSSPPSRLRRRVWEGRMVVKWSVERAADLLPPPPMGGFFFFFLMLLKYFVIIKIKNNG